MKTAWAWYLQTFSLRFLLNAFKIKIYLYKLWPFYIKNIQFCKLPNGKIWFSNAGKKTRCFNFLCLIRVALSVSKVTCQFKALPFWRCEYVTASTWVMSDQHSCSGGGCLTDGWLMTPWWDGQTLIDRSNHLVWQRLCDTNAPLSCFPLISAL